ncbi:hypothetical protein [uncultured Streptococcus sp.]|uniref:hypothetical protein n=1 Tax=uncultured Streptococcus sp. TaxID=83427 RepID=UPI0027DC2221|nr:hypothetical protein [uncultured Streptococcus sp.]
MTNKEYMAQSEEVAREMETVRAEFMAQTFEDLTLYEKQRYLEVGSRIMQEDTTLNLYELYKHPEARAKLFVLVARIALDLDKKFPTQWRLDKFVETMEEHYTNMVKARIVSTDRQAVSHLMQAIEEDKKLSPEQYKSIAKSLIVSGLLSD